MKQDKAAINTQKSVKTHASVSRRTFRSMAVSLAALMLLISGLSALVSCGSDKPTDYKYKLTVTDATIQGLENKELESLKLPASIDGVPVTRIGNKAFAECVICLIPSRKSAWRHLPTASVCPKSAFPNH